MVYELILFIMTATIIIIVEYLNYVAVNSSTIKCENINYLSNTLMFDIEGILEYITGEDVELRLGTDGWKSIRLPFKQPVIVSNIYILMNSSMRHLSIRCLIHEACHIASKSSIKVLLVKASLIPTIITLNTYIAKHSTTYLAFISIVTTLTLTYLVIRFLNKLDEDNVNKCLSKYFTLTSNHGINYPNTKRLELRV